MKDFLNLQLLRFYAHFYTIVTVMKSIRFLHTAVLLLMATFGFAQRSLQIAERVHNLGNIAWQEPVTVAFHVQNISREAITVSDLRTDCGCTLATMSQTEILPGRELQINVRYDAEMLGQFSKRVSFRSSSEAEPITLTLTGRVVLDASGKAEVYPFHIGDVSLSQEMIEFDDVYRGETPVQTIRVYNGSQQTIEPEFLRLPKYLSATCSPKVIYPGRNGVIDVVLNPNEIENYGLTQTQVFLGTFKGQRVSTDNALDVAVTLLPTSALSTSASGQVPVLDIANRNLSVGALNGKKKIKAETFLSNNGTAPLQIEAIQVYNPGLSVSIDKQRLEPGATAKVKITVNKLIFNFKGRYRILLLTNDPQCPKATIDVQVEP